MVLARGLPITTKNGRPVDRACRLGPSPLFGHERIFSSREEFRPIVFLFVTKDAHRARVRSSVAEMFPPQAVRCSLNELKTNNCSGG